MDKITEQIEICNRYGSNYLPPELLQKVGVAIETVDIFPLNALRVSPENGTCGWYIWGGGEMSMDDDFFTPMHVTHLSERCPQLIPYIALAPGWRVQLAPGREDVWFDNTLFSK